MISVLAFRVGVLRVGVLGVVTTSGSDRVFLAGEDAVFFGTSLVTFSDFVRAGDLGLPGDLPRLLDLDRDCDLAGERDLDLPRLAEMPAVFRNKTCSV